jgi:hypothetical protein
MADWYQRILDEYHKERKTASFYKTQGYRKLLRYVIAILASDKFQKTVKQMRVEYEIPAAGFSIPDKGSWSHPPNEWTHKEDPTVLERIRQTFRTFCRERGLLPRDWHRTFENYLFYNRHFITTEPNAKNLCFVSDGVTSRDSLGHVVDEIDREIYPVTLHISAYASERDILDYILAVYNPEIKRVQKEYRKPDVGIGKYKKRNVAVLKRNIVMYENRTDSNEKIAGLVKEKFPEKPLRPSSIGKTVARERKRRQQP